MEEGIIKTMADFGIAAGRIDGLTGVWVDFEEGAKDPRKVCAMGVKLFSLGNYAWVSTKCKF